MSGSPLKPDKRKIIISESGFGVADSKSHFGVVAWNEVYLIVAYKRDLFTIDLICLEFYLDGIEQTLEIDEEMSGYALLVETLPAKFDGFDKEWWRKVSHPAFATNTTELWRRK